MRTIDKPARSTLANPDLELKDDEETKEAQVVFCGDYPWKTSNIHYDLDPPQAAAGTDVDLDRHRYIGSMLGAAMLRVMEPSRGILSMIFFAGIANKSYIVRDFQVRRKLPVEDQERGVENKNHWGVPSTYYHVSAVMLNPELYEAREWGPHVEWNGEKFVRKDIPLDMHNLAVLYQFYMDMVNVSLGLIYERLEAKLTCGRDRGYRGCGIHGRKDARYWCGGQEAVVVKASSSTLTSALSRHRRDTCSRGLAPS